MLYLTQVDAYLAGKVASGHQVATTFVLDLLDHFVLPSLTGSASAAAANDSSPTGGAPQASAAGNLPEALTVISSKREFTVLNEYDLWLTIQALHGQQTATLSAPPSDAHLRLRLSCARVRALLDLGLLEEEPVTNFYVPSSPEAAALYAGCSRAREFDDTQTMKHKTEGFFRWWIDVYKPTMAPDGSSSTPPPPNDPAYAELVMTQLTNLGVLHQEENLTRFFRLATIYVVERALNNLKHVEQAPPSIATLTRVSQYVELDAYARLISIVVNKAGGNNPASSHSVKITILNKVLGIIAGTLLQSHEVRPEFFHSMPFERILVMLFADLYSPAVLASCNPTRDQEPTNDDKSESAQNFITLHEYIPLAFGQLLHILRPERATNFIFAWLEMVAHRRLVDKLLGPAPDAIPARLRTAYRATYAQLLVDLLKFLSFYLQNALLPKPIVCLYTATFRLCLVLFHDFADFVSEYCVLFCDLVPSNSLQLRNLLLSAEPKRGVPTTDPLNVSFYCRYSMQSRNCKCRTNVLYRFSLQTPQIDQLDQLEDPIGYCMDAGSRLPPVLRNEIDSYIASRAPVKFLSELVTMLRRTDNLYSLLVSPPSLITSAVASVAAVTSNTGKEDEEASSGTPAPTGKKAKKAAAAKAAALAAQQQAAITAAAQQTNAATLWSARATQMLATFGLTNVMHYNVELMMNLVLYVCITAIKELRDSGMPLNMTTIAHTAQMDIIQSLVVNLDNEGRYLLLNCMANQLRYSNSHTYYFFYTILYLFAEQSKEQVKEQISRVLMERLIVNRPHPWGLLMTSAELLRNPAYKFWDHGFARCHKDMEK